ncbi:amino acid ABC transporter permease [Chromobacterium subtsugae]|uniref:Amino acid ABC transporter permease n=1 Tax=Chromobacterium subtsugae TaxID=251747 RepID=A0ABS7FFZ1_9NEIS|nr:MULTISPECIES: amino acid ABC transporter permease [Chromobacterium]KUM03965.1 ABC transporter permease [Chromobacterium subtsugae]KZE86426.1 ABC transporter permease [Chromobacterium sp. F49]MBW7567685.1 amino acid ABC transporter permease [Chromobacterium subtsugae]MBW8288911.1 amino acid ABC transporter permease [Chromobacterium subtsugae]WSE91296.1 amino acid ABC transporter permease [Chromobacterium subtsugae]
MSDWMTLFESALPVLLKGAGYTLAFALVAMVLGLALGFAVAMVRVAKLPLLSQLAAFYVSAMRGTPLLVQIFVIYYGLPGVGLELDPVPAGVLALTLNVAAYLSESLRGGIAGVAKGQWDAAFSLGLSWWQTMRHIIAPQALRLSVPSLSNSLISLIKDTSLVSVITVTELMLATKEVIAQTFQPLPLYLAAAAIYWLLSAAFERIQRRVEDRLELAHRR